MGLLSIRLADGRTVDFDVDDDADKEAYFVLGVRKCGSSIMNSMIDSLARINNIKFIDVAGKFFEKNVTEHDWRNDPAVLDMIRPGNLYGGFRAMPFVFRKSPMYQAARKILLVRDPRDALVSEYFSSAFSHSLPKQEQEEGGAHEEFMDLRQRALSAHIEEYVSTRAAPLNRTLCWYEDVVADPRTLLFRYEDVILNKRRWLADMAAHFGWDGGSEPFIEGMMGWADVVPSEERRTEFVRKVVPGDHREKLTPEVIESLNRELAPSMKLFGYV